MHPLIPLSALLAEIEAFPFASEAAHQHRITWLALGPSGVLQGDSERLGTALLETLLPRAGGMSIASLRLLIDHVWFGKSEAFADSADPAAALSITEPRVLSLAEYAGRVAARYLALAGNRVQLHGSVNRPECAESFRWLTLHLPQDFLIAALAARESFAEPPPDPVRLVSPQLAEVLQQGCAETHLHRGAALPFSTLWSALVKSLSGPDSVDFSRLGTTRQEGTPHNAPQPGGSTDQLELFLLAAAITRILLAAYLLRYEANGPARSFSQFLQCKGPGTLSAICRQFPWNKTWRTPSAEQACQDAIRQVLFGHSQTWRRPIWHSLHRLLRGALTHSRLSIDPIEDWLIPQPGIADTETRFAHRCLRHLLSAYGSQDELFGHVFFQYQRLRSQLYQYVVQKPGTAGLDWFCRHFDRISPLRAPIDSKLFDIALQTESRDVHLASLEIRRSPSKHWYDIRDSVREVASGRIQYHSLIAAHKPEVGLVLHFVKAQATRIAGKRFLYADPGALTARSRHGLWFQERSAEAAAICRSLRMYPEHLLLLRGIDVANTELAQPTWVLLPLWKQVFAVVSEVAALLARRQPRWGVSPLRSTIHAGEDFARLIQGLRRMHEPIEFGLLKFGDRIGHGMALGVDPKLWATQLPQAPQTLDERLDDLVWELERYQKRELSVDSSRLEYVRAEILRLARIQYTGTSDISVDDLILARRLRHIPSLLQRIGYPNLSSWRRKMLPNDKAHDLLWRYLTDHHVFLRGEQTLLVRCDETEQRLISEAQKWLRTIIGKLEITIESNPSSNLLIGGFPSLESLPVLRMQPIKTKSAHNAPPLLVSLNTDNPITFSSSLSDEMSHVYYGLLRSHVQASSALAWIDRVRRNGWHSRFTLPSSASDEALRIVRDSGRV